MEISDYLDSEFFIKEDVFEHDGQTIISVQETDASGQTVCSGCKQPINMHKAYAHGITIDEKTKKFYTVHKLCRVLS